MSSMKASMETGSVLGSTKLHSSPVIGTLVISLGTKKTRKGLLVPKRTNKWSLQPESRYRGGFGLLFVASSRPSRKVLPLIAMYHYSTMYATPAGIQNAMKKN